MNGQENLKTTASADSGGLPGSKLTTVFAIVLAAHVIIIVIALSWYFLSGRSDNTVVDQTNASPSPVAEKATPRLETEPLISSEVLETMNTATSSERADPVWATTPAPLPNADPFADVEPAPTAPAGYTVAPLPPLAPLAQTAPAPVAVPVETAAALSRPGAPTPVVPPTETAALTKPSAPAKTLETTTYRVVQGDTLSRIARRHGTTVAEIKRINGLSSDHLKINQVLKVSGPAPAKDQTSAKVKASTAREWTATHTVAAGETLYRISQTYKTTPAALAKANKISDPTKVRVGTVLRVPGSSTAQAAPKPVTATPAREAKVSPAPASAPVPAAQPTPPTKVPVREAKAAPELKPFRPPVLTKEMVMMNM